VFSIFLVLNPALLTSVTIAPSVGSPISEYLCPVSFVILASEQRLPVIDM